MDKLEQLLYENLPVACDPDPELNRQILKRRSEDKMKQTNILKRAAAFAIICAAAGSATVYAVYQYLNPSQIVEELADNEALARIFEGEDAISVNETQTSGAYDITLLGVVSGTDLAPYVEDEEAAEELQGSHMYATLAISHTDGTPLEETEVSKCVSPLIGGVDWSIANNGSLDTYLMYFLQDGVVYQLMECDSLEIFADRGVWIGVVDSFGEEPRAFVMDEETGDYQKVESYEGTSALFKLPLDPARADADAADAYLEQLKNPVEEGEETETFADAAYGRYMELMEDAISNSGELLANAVAIEGTRQTLTVAEDGYVTYGFRTEESGGGTILVEGLETGRPTVLGAGGDGTLAGMELDVFTLNEDGTVTYEQYRPVMEE